MVIFVVKFKIKTFSKSITNEQTANCHTRSDSNRKN